MDIGDTVKITDKRDGVFEGRKGTALSVNRPIGMASVALHSRWFGLDRAINVWFDLGELRKV